MYFIRAKLQDNVDINMVLEISTELDNISMMQTLMYFNLTHEFLLGSRLD